MQAGKRDLCGFIGGYSDGRFKKHDGRGSGIPAQQGVIHHA
jgi:hypothetical protein